jgi:type I restriction enzyme S subunit
LKASNCEVFPVGTILIAMYGQGLTRGRTGKLGIPATTNQACAAILPSPKINTDYLWTFLKLSYNEIRDLGRGGNQPNLNLSMVRDLVIPVPPLSLQEEFAGVVARVESLRGRMGESERQVEGLFESLLAEAFKA